MLLDVFGLTEKRGVRFGVYIDAFVREPEEPIRLLPTAGNSNGRRLAGRPSLGGIARRNSCASALTRLSRPIALRRRARKSSLALPGSLAVGKSYRKDSLFKFFAGRSLFERIARGYEVNCVLTRIVEFQKGPLRRERPKYLSDAIGSLTSNHEHS